MMQYSITQLSELVDLPVRTIRFYIQKGLVDRPIGERKAAKYNEHHAEQCLQIKKWSQAGLSLDKIAAALTAPPDDLPEPPRQPGEIGMLTTIHLAQGVDLYVDQTLANLDQSTLQEIVTSILTVMDKHNHE